MACETLLADDLVVVAGGFHLEPEGAFEQVRRELDGIVRRLLRETGYRARFPGINPASCEAQIRVHGQSAQIAGLANCVASWL